MSFNLSSPISNSQQSGDNKRKLPTDSNETSVSSDFNGRQTKILKSNDATLPTAELTNAVALTMVNTPACSASSPLSAPVKVISQTEPIPDIIKKFLAKDPEAIEIVSKIFDGTPPPNFDEIVRCLHTLADQGHLKAMEILGIEYSVGNQDCSKAMQYLRPVVDHVLQTPSIFASSNPGPQDPTALTSDEKILIATKSLIKREGRPSNFTYLTKVNPEAFSQLLDYAVAYLGFCLLENESDKRGLEFCLKAIELGLNFDMPDYWFPYYLNWLLSDRKIDHQLIKKSLEKAVERGSPRAWCMLGVFYNNGSVVGIPKDTNKAIFWLEKAALAGVVYAMNSLSFIYSQPEHQNLILAMRWLRLCYWFNQSFELDLKDNDKILQICKNLCVQFTTDPVIKGDYMYLEASIKNCFKMQDWVNSLVESLATDRPNRPWSNSEFWKNDQELHLCFGFEYIEHLGPNVLASVLCQTCDGGLGSKIFNIFVGKITDYIDTVRKGKTLSQEREEEILPLLEYLQRIDMAIQENQDDFCKKTKIFWRERITLLCVAHHLENSNYLETLPHLKQIELGKESRVFLAKLLFQCDSWRFPDIMEDQARYVLIASLLLESEVQDPEDLVLLNQMNAQLRAGRATCGSSPEKLNFEDLKKECPIPRQERAKMVKRFLELLKNQNSEFYFRYYSMEWRLAEGLNKLVSLNHPRKIERGREILHLLGNLLQNELGDCRNGETPIYTPEFIDALDTLIAHCVKIVTSENAMHASQLYTDLISQPLMKKWIRKIPGLEEAIKHQPSLNS